MMNRFVSNRQACFALGVALVLACSGPLIQPGYADTSWADILKPLVKDVIIPGASAGMKKLVKKMESKDGASATSTQAADSSTPEVITIDPSTANTDATTPTEEQPKAPESSSTASAVTDSTVPPPPPPPPSP